MVRRLVLAKLSLARAKGILAMISICQVPERMWNGLGGAGRVRRGLVCARSTYVWGGYVVDWY